MPRFVPVLIIYAVCLSLSACYSRERFLIVNADDVGMALEINRATFNAMERGIIRSASIMVPAPCFEDALDYARKHPEFSWGLHLTLTSEWDNYRWGPILGKESVPSLVDQEGFFHKKTSTVAAIANRNEIDRELRAQIDYAVARGLRPSHLDTHMYALFERADLLNIFINLGIDYQIPILLFRQPEEYFASDDLQLTATWNSGIKRLEQTGLPVLEFYDLSNYGIRGSQKKSYILSLIRRLATGVSLVALHPGENTAWLRQTIDSATNRAFDAEIAMDSEVKKAIRDNKIRLISWKDFRTMQRDVRQY